MGDTNKMTETSTTPICPSDTYKDSGATSGAIYGAIACDIYVECWLDMLLNIKHQSTKTWIHLLQQPGAIGASLDSVVHQDNALLWSATATAAGAGGVGAHLWWLVLLTWR